MKFLKEMLEGQKGEVSSKRTLAFAVAVVLAFMGTITPMNSFLIFAGAALGISGLEKFK